MLSIRSCRRGRAATSRNNAERGLDKAGIKVIDPCDVMDDDPETRDTVQNIYSGKVERVDGELYNVEFATFEAVKDAGKTKK
jgi:hypothetical protein